MTASTALAERIAGDLTQVLAEAEQAITALVEAGDSGRLTEVRAQADAHRLYEERAGAIDRSCIFAEIKLLAEAGLGALSYEAYPTLNVRTHPEGIFIGEELVSFATARTWRTLADAHERGHLRGVIAERARANDSLNSFAVADVCIRRGVSRVPASLVRQLLEAEARRRDISYTALCRNLGVHTATGRCSRITMTWPRAREVADALGVDPSSWPLAPATRPRRRRQRLWLTRQRKPTGGRWDETYARFRRCLDEFARIAGEDTKWDEAYSHFYALEKTIAREMKRG